MKVTKSQLKQIIKEEFQSVIEAYDPPLPRLTQLPDDPETPMSPEEQKMDALTADYEERLTHNLITGIEVPDFDGKMLSLDNFLAKLGNYVVTGDVSPKLAGRVIRQIQNAMRIDPRELDYVHEEEEEFIGQAAQVGPDYQGEY